MGSCVCSRAPSADSGVLVKMSAPPFFFFMGHNFSLTPHLLRLLLSLLLSARRIRHRLHSMEGLISCNYEVISVAIIGSVCSEKVTWHTTHYLPRRVIVFGFRGLVCLRRCSCAPTGALPSIYSEYTVQQQEERGVPHETGSSLNMPHTEVPPQCVLQQTRRLKRRVSASGEGVSLQEPYRRGLFYINA